MPQKPATPIEEYYGIKILRDGTWLYGGTPITRHNLVKLFASVLQKDQHGDYWLITPYEKGRIEVEDVPFVALEMRMESSGKGQILHFRTNIDEWVTLKDREALEIRQDPVTQAPVPYIMVRDGIAARVARAVYYDLIDIAVESDHEKGLLGLWSNKKFYPLGHM